MLIISSVLFLLGMGAFVWLDAKKREAFPKKFSVTRFLGLNNKKKATPDPSIWYTQCGLIRERNRKRQRKLKNQALYELAKDFHSAGLYDRSEKIFKNLSEFSSYNLSCSEELIKLYEVTKDWDAAIEIVNNLKVDEINNHKKDLLVSQYLCEISSDHYENSEIERAVAVSKKAQKSYPDCLRSLLQLAEYYSSRDVKLSLQYYYNAIIIDESFAKYILNKIIGLSKNSENDSSVLDTVNTISEIKSLTFIPDIFIYLFYQLDKETALRYSDKFRGNDEFEEFLINSTIVISGNEDIVKTSMIESMLDSYKKIFSKDFLFLCKSCGYKSTVLNWLCPSCNNWCTSSPKTTFDLIGANAKNVRQ